MKPSSPLAHNSTDTFQSSFYWKEAHWTVRLPLLNDVFDLSSLNAVYELFTNYKEELLKL